MSFALDDLDPQFYPLACQLIARSCESGIPLKIIFTGRTQQEQIDLYAQGRTRPGAIVTWTLNSKHVMKPPDYRSRAIDLCPYDEYRLHGPDKLRWDAADPVWQKLGAIGEHLGLKWGVVRNGERIDLGHFEFVESALVSPALMWGES